MNKTLRHKTWRIYCYTGMLLLTVGLPAGADIANPPTNPQSLMPESENTDDSINKQPKSRGQLLYENHCTVCHDSQAHIRKQRKAKSYSDIMYWVSRWSTHLELKWNKSDITDVANYLNAAFYQFEHTEID